ncbi:MAG: 3-methyl-2-oxobutanoate dehydrogenase subunit VorB [Spirochaetaceae bacterium]|nr:MAG: 3-methyl-2-oxobutanoate dehydrogenase subunit VorB [Spirochaetaceae bacterium]
MKQLMKGNEAVVHGALVGGATHFFGYPITPASEIAHAAADFFPRTGRHFLQAESEVAAINMIYGAAGAGARTMTASSGPGVSLMAEGLSYIAGAELPCVIVDVQRAGPGLGNIWPEQSDYNMVVKGGGHGNYHNAVYVPNSAQEMCDMTAHAFDIADRYRVTVFILSDAYIGQMMEPVEIPDSVHHAPAKPWALGATSETRDNLITSIHMSTADQAAHNWKLKAKYDQMEAEITDWEEVFTDDADTLFVAFGITARICLTAVQRLRARGVRAGLLRPKTVFPFPRTRIAELVDQGPVREIAVVELNDGMMADDVQLAAPSVRVHRLNWLGGQVPTAEQVLEMAAQKAGQR